MRLLLVVFRWDPINVCEIPAYQNPGAKVRRPKSHSGAGPLHAGYTQSGLGGGSYLGNYLGKRERSLYLNLLLDFAKATNGIADTIYARVPVSVGA